MRLIDADALDEEIREYQMDRVALATALKVIANQPTVEMSSAMPEEKRQLESKTAMQKNLRTGIVQVDNAAR